MLIDALQYSKPSRERFEEWRRAGIDAVHVTVSIWEDTKETMRELGRWQTRFRDHADLITPVTTAADIERARAEGRTGVILGFQNVTAFEDDLDLVGAFHSAGVRIVQLTYNIQNAAGAGCWEREDVGLSQTYGVRVVREMNTVGMLVDTSHCNDRTTLDAVEASEKPVVATHANPRSFVGEDVELAYRNKSDEALREIAACGGVVGLSMYPRLAPGGDNCTLEQFCEMVLWTAEKIGVQHVGFGSDFYTGYDEEIIAWWRQGRWSRSSMKKISGLVNFPDWFDAGSGYQAVLERLGELGLNDEELRSVSGGNWARVFGEVFPPR
jgi:membrane dipeptidase